MSLSGTGEYDAPHKGDDGENPYRHAWYPPRPASGDGVLMMRNTLTGRKEPFVPHSKGRVVRWYTCGPTVYDVAHVGHARTYLSLDIMRRIMSDYFHYHVLYQINTTDIDDKIILRARQNVLIQQLTDNTSVDGPALQQMVQTALQRAQTAAHEKTLAQEKALQEAMDKNDSRARAEHETLLEQAKLKEKNLARDAAAIAAAGADRSQLLQAGRSVLAEYLDRLSGHTVTDHAVFNGHARKYEREFMQDMDALGIRPPDVLTRVTEYIPPILAFIQKIIDKDMAYASNGSVYLSIDNFKQQGFCYRKLSPAADKTSAAEMAEGEGALSSTDEAKDKRNRNDFALWKASKPGEPAWESPWGPGRPGWHIECSVVASDVLGEVLDIHAGGEDLKFPHHDNELAQSEACLGHTRTADDDASEQRPNQWVNYFVHTGHLHIEGLKMSKSLKNFITIRQALENNTARQLRLMFLLQAWDQPMNYSDQAVDDVRAKETTFKSFFREMQAICRGDYLADEVGWRMGEADHALADAFLQAQDTVHQGLLDNFNTKEAMLALLKLIGHVNVYLRMPNVQPAVLLLRSIAVYVTQILKVFGVCTGQDDFGFYASESGAAGEEAVQGGGADAFIDTLVSFREKVRNAALEGVKGGDATAALKAILATCDELRDEVLPTVGVRVEDRPGATRWTREDPAAMMQELAEKKARETEVKISKLEKKLAAKEKELEKITAARVPPEKLFRTDEYKEWDSDGLPITLANGEAVSGGQVKKKKKLLDKQKKLYEDLMAKTDGNPDALAQATQAEMEDLKQQLDQLSL